MNRIGLALGGGGARGLAHIRFLEAFDELGIKPSIIAGCSMGAIVGALYASGCPGREIRGLVEENTLPRGDSFRDLWRMGLHILRLLTRLTPETHRGGMVNVDRLFGYLLEPLRGKTFGDLEIPLVVVATDFWKAEEVVLEEGDVLPAIRASSSIPGLFAPRTLGGRVLVDGALTNELPYDHLRGRCDVTIAINVAGERYPEKETVPSSFDASAGAIEILQGALLEAKLEHAAPDLMVHPRLKNIELLDFLRVRDIFEQCDPALETFRSDLARLGLEPSRQDG